MKVKLFQVRLDEEFINADQLELNIFLESVTVRRSAAELIQSIPKYWSVLLIYSDETESKVGMGKLDVRSLISKTPISISKPINNQELPNSDLSLNSEELVRLESLKQWRNETAGRLNLRGYMVTSNATLVNIAKFNPQTVESLINIKGLGPNKVQRFGNDILTLLNA